MNMEFLIWFIICVVSSPKAVTGRGINGKLDNELLVNVSKNNEVIIIYNYTKTSNYSTYLRAFAEADVPSEHTVFVTINDGSEQLEYMKLRYRDNVTIERAESTIFPMSNGRIARSSDKYMEQQLTLTVFISTESIYVVTVKIEIRTMTDFKLETDTIRNITISDTSSAYFLYKFDNETEQVNAVVDSEDDAPMLLSIQNEESQVFDLAENVKYKGSYQTVTRKGSMVVQKSKTPNNSFIIVFVFNLNEGTLRKKSVSLVIKKILNQNEYPIGYLVWIHIGMFLIAAFIDCLYYYILLKTDCCTKLRNCCNSETTRDPQASAQENETDGDETKVATTTCCGKCIIMGMNVSDLSKRNRSIDRNNMYIWYIVIVFVSYLLPVVQHVIGHQLAVHSTGNQDTCFFNYRCSRPWGIFMAYNNMISNIGYVIGGIIFIFIVRNRQSIDLGEMDDCALTDTYYKGLPKCYKLSYAMGFGLIMEGILSACYHICPNYYNFQFDMAYMYLLACLCIVKLYQGRHQDIGLSVNEFYLLMAVFSLVSVISLIWDGVIFRCVFIGVYLAYSVMLAIDLYNKREWTWLYPLYCCKLSDDLEIVCFSNENGKSVQKENHASESTNARKGCNLRKIYRIPILLLFIIGNICITMLGIYLNMIIFCICVGNLLLYLVIYLITKCLYCEYRCWMTFIYLAIAGIFWILAFQNFKDNQTHWKGSPAESRIRNRDCVYWEFFDVHDVWHIQSSIALFFSFLVVISIDDHLMDRERSRIPIF